MKNTERNVIRLLKKNCERLATALADSLSTYATDKVVFVSAERQEAWLDALARHEALVRGHVVPEPEPLSFIEE